MPTSHSRPLRRLSLLLGALVAGAALLPAGPTATAQSAPAPHWGEYKWNGGTETAPVRAFWLVDRSGDPTTNVLISHVANAWNAARADFPDLPFIAVHKDAAGPCFVNETPGFSVASACMFQNIPWAKVMAATNPDDTGHMVGAAFAISAGMDWEEALTAVCYGFGVILGLDESDNEDSCMHPASTPGEFKWYDDADAEAVLDLYDHDDSPEPTTTTTSTTVDPTTTSTSSTSTTTTLLPDLCDVVPLPVGCPEPTTTTVPEPTTTTVPEPTTTTVPEA